MTSVPLLTCLLLLAWWASARAEQVLAHCKSPYNELLVIQDGYERILKVRQGKAFVEQSRCDQRRPAALRHQYSRLQMLGTLYPEQFRRVLVLGLGGASLSKALQLAYPEVEQDCIELDPEIARLARKYFGYREGPRCRTHVGDGRQFLEDNAQTWDLIVLDAFDGLEIPQPLRTREFYQLVQSRLAPGGVVVSNLHRRSHSYARDRATLACVYPQQLAFEGTGLVIVLSSQSPVQAHPERWSSMLGFDFTPLQQLQERDAQDFSQAQPFEDGKP
jgi:spermidine synthase